MKQITWTGAPGLETYQSADGTQIGEGETIEVSDEKAEQLLTDFPHLCALKGQKPTKAAAAPAPTADETEAEAEAESDGQGDAADDADAGDETDGATDDGDGGEPAAAAPKRRARKKPE